MLSIFARSVLGSLLVAGGLAVGGCSTQGGPGATASNSYHPTSYVDEKGHTHYGPPPSSQMAAPYALTGSQPLRMKAVVDEKGHTRYVPVWGAPR